MDNPRSCPIVWMPLLLGLYVAGGCGSNSIPERAAFKGHGDRIISIAFAPDGKTLASRSSDDTVKLWDVPLCRERMSVSGFPSDMGGLAFSPDGARLATNEALFGAEAWDATSGDNRSTYRYPVRQEPAMGCYSVSYGWGIAYSSDGKALAAGGSNQGEDGFVTLWDAASGEGEDLGHHEAPVTAVAFSPGGGVVASGSLDGTVRLWDLAAGNERACLRGHGAPVYAICYSPDGTTLVSAGGDRTVKLWDTASGREMGTFTGHRAAVCCVAFRRDGQVVASGDRRGAVLLWEVSTRRAIAELPRQTGGVGGVAFSPVEDLLASGGGDGMIRLWALPGQRDTR